MEKGLQNFLFHAGNDFCIIFYPIYDGTCGMIAEVSGNTAEKPEIIFDGKVWQFDGEGFIRGKGEQKCFSYTGLECCIIPVGVIIFPPDAFRTGSVFYRR